MKSYLFSIACYFFSTTLLAQNISTYAGSGPTGFMTGSYGGDGGAATAASLYDPGGAAFDTHGNLFFADVNNNRIRKIDASGKITTIAGTGTPGFSGDGGPAVSAQLSFPTCVCFDAAGNLYIADAGNMRIRKIDILGTISTVAGSGMQGFSGDGYSALAAKLNNPDFVKVDAAGNIYVIDWGNNRIRKINTLGIINTIVGNGSSAYSGDSIMATSAGIAPSSIVFDKKGNMIVSDALNNRIRKIDASGIITTVAGTGSAGYSGDGGLATMADFRGPRTVIFDKKGNLLFCDENNNCIRKIDTLGIITTICGNGTGGFSGDGGPATSAQLHYPDYIVFDVVGDLYISDLWNNRIRKVSYPPSAVNDVKEVHLADVYPNPAVNILHVDNLKQATNYQLIGISGHVVMQGSFGAPNSTLSLERINKGIYFLQLYTDKSEHGMVKLVKE